MYDYHRVSHYFSLSLTGDVWQYTYLQGSIDLREVQVRAANEKSRPFAFTIRSRHSDTLQPPYFIAAKDQPELEDWLSVLITKVWVHFLCVFASA